MVGPDRFSVLLGSGQFCPTVFRRFRAELVGKWPFLAVIGRFRVALGSEIVLPDCFSVVSGSEMVGPDCFRVVLGSK